eukprot:m.52607 g.52607  ORF g.52607 m.52607 type:complete len:266 (+) comp7626_c0_seq2:78-875(+)
MLDLSVDGGKFVVVIVIVIVTLTSCIGVGAGFAGGVNDGSSITDLNERIGIPENSSWIVFAMLTHPNPHRNATLSKISVNMTVPTSPTNLFGPTSPGWYLCLITKSGNVFVRSVVAWGVIRSEFSAFHEIYGEDVHKWWQGELWHVLSGDVVTLSVVRKDNTYVMTYLRAQDPTRNVTNIITMDMLDNEDLTDVAFVMDHTPAVCSELPQSSTLFSITELLFDNAPVPLSWTIHKNVDCCAASASVLPNGTQIEFSWHNAKESQC